METVPPSDMVTRQCPKKGHVQQNTSPSETAKLSCNIGCFPTKKDLKLVLV
jgi:hypothetical protein